MYSGTLQLISYKLASFLSHFWMVFVVIPLPSKPLFGRFNLDVYFSKTIFSWNTLVVSSFQKKQPREAQDLFVKKLEIKTVSWKGLVSGYVSTGMIIAARKMFNRKPYRNVVLDMVWGYMQEGMVKEMESLIWKMPEKWSLGLW